MGRAGRALLFLLPHEDAYVGLLEARNVPMTQREPPAATTSAVDGAHVGLDTQQEHAECTTASPRATCHALTIDETPEQQQQSAGDAQPSAGLSAVSAARQSGEPSTINEQDAAAQATQLPAHIPARARRLAERDRDVMEKATKAFVSYVRGYKEHQCRYIFQLSELDLTALGRMFGILRLPVMKEVRPCQASAFCVAHDNVVPSMCLCFAKLRISKCLVFHETCPQCKDEVTRMSSNDHKEREFEFAGAKKCDSPERVSAVQCPP
jgi:Domain of unknown function (DUF4217)